MCIINYTHILFSNYTYIFMKSYNNNYYILYKYIIQIYILLLHFYNKYAFHIFK